MGEYTGEGQRVRRDGSTFWAGVTLTALRDEDGTLLANAVKFTPADGEVRVSAGSADQLPPGAAGGPGPFAYVRVEDAGPGIAPGRLAAVFEPFVQAAAGPGAPPGGSR